MGSVTDNPIIEDAITVDELPAIETNNETLFTITKLRPIASLHRMWTNYYLQGKTLGEGVMIPGLDYVIAGLLSFAQIKSQGETGFPFQTHPQASMAAVSSLVLYGMASAVEHAISNVLTDPPSVNAIIARLGRKCSLYILVGSLASLFYL